MSPLRQRLPKNVGFTKAELKRYMGYIAALPCVLCVAEAEVCHVRYAEVCPECEGECGHFFKWAEPPMEPDEDGTIEKEWRDCTPCSGAGFRYGKRPTGKGEKPTDTWVLPLCPAHHRLDNEAQHQSNEREWWGRQGIDPLSLCVALQDAYNTGLSMPDKIEGGVAVLEEFRRAA